MKRTIPVIVLLFACLSTMAIETKIIVRAKAKDAKFIGNSIGGAYVIIRNNVNQQVLAEGKTIGSTGNTTLIMKTPKERNGSITDDQTAKFTATLDIDEPTFVSIEVIAPFNKKQAQATVSTALWLIPGKDILGDGIVLEVPGFVVDILQPRTHQYLSLSEIKNNPFVFQANVVMMCGCPIEKGGLWNAEDMEVKGILRKNGKLLKEVDMSVTSTSLFEGSASVDTAGTYELIVYAYNPNTGNTGVDKINYVVKE